MSVVEMSKIRLIGLTNYRESILNALHETGAVELKETEDLTDTFTVSDADNIEILTKKYARICNAIDFLTVIIEKEKKNVSFSNEVKESFKNFVVGYGEFSSAHEKEKEVLDYVSVIEDCQKQISDNRSQRLKLNSLRAQVLPFVGVKGKLSIYKDTETTSFTLGTIKQERLSFLSDLFKEYPLSCYDVEKSDGVTVISVLSYKDESGAVLKKLNEAGFVRCPFEFDMTAAEKISEIDETLDKIEKADRDVRKNLCLLADKMRDVKIYADYIEFCIEKAKCTENFRCTVSTFIMEGYLPTVKKEEVINCVKEVTNAFFVEFIKPAEDETVPTLLDNNPVLKQTEFITELYSVPNYREIDPSKVVFFFFMIFMGVIMADVGYGFLMIIFGLVLARRIKVDSGARRLWYIISIGGIFTVLFGTLFNSFLGFSLSFIPTFLPSPIPDESGSTEGMMIILLGCLGLGVLQMATGYFCKAVNCFKQGDVVGGIFDGLVWVLFFVGFVFASFNFLISYLIPELVLPVGVYGFFSMMQLPGIIMTVGSVVVAALTAGRNEKGFGKFSKGFGSVYGLINIMSDILSYARLFGLMLSGMIIAQTFNDLGLGIIAGGGVGFVFGAIVMLLGHTFNIAMGVLGAYIHDSRLQYIEFFSKFYTGEGEKFTPFASEFEYIYLAK